MVPLRGRLGFRQYMPGKRHKFGIKLYKLCLPESYTKYVVIYAGKNGKVIKICHSQDVVMKLRNAYREKKSQKKNVLLMSTFEKAQNKRLQSGKRNAQIQVEKPAIVAEYNKHMGGVDTSDMMLYSYLDERRAIKY
ncbi:uncharacterized protein LOC113380616 [Ctenocephalides felis]|uniref:uncharacterized protein LOC113380616 n=1 Tax=Ctenocephalides felis TaxID=7515 RepID=UPI000E6E4BAD|nr:uncharacterized protein LOC113380616 [Ctenocephalides felis]